MKTTIAVISWACIVSGAGIIAFNLYDMGAEHGKASVSCPLPKIVDRTTQYSPKELRIMANWRERLERVK